MKYTICKVLVGFTEEDLAAWSEHSDMTFGLARALNHGDDANVYLIEHEDLPSLSEEEASKLKHLCLTEEGGV